MGSRPENFQQEYDRELEGDLAGLQAELDSGGDVLMALVNTLRRAHLRPTPSERKILVHGTAKEGADVMAKIAIEAILPPGAVKSPRYTRDIPFELGRPD